MSRERAERRDVKRHREQLLAAAAKVFNEHGVHVALELVVQEAGLSKGSLYRHFPDRASLVIALFRREAEAMFAHGATLPAEEALLGMLRYLIDTAGRAPALAEGWRIVATDHPDYAAGRARLIEGLEAPLDAARRTGVVRADLTAADVSMIIRLITLSVAGPDGAARGDRALELLLHGALRAETAA